LRDTYSNLDAIASASDASLSAISQARYDLPIHKARHASICIVPFCRTDALKRSFIDELDGALFEKGRFEEMRP
jgi:hypothetical protein